MPSSIHYAITVFAWGFTWTAIHFPVDLYWGAMAFLVLVGSVAAFGSYLTPIRRIGAARAGYATVLFPVVALMASTGLEGYTWTALAMLGAVFAAAGNVLMFWRPRARHEVAAEQPRHAASRRPG